MIFKRNKNKAAHPEQKVVPSLENDLQRLISDLENTGMNNLVRQMDNDNIYSDFLIEKRKSEISNTDSISWYAYRQSEKLSSESDKKELLELLSNDKFVDLKKYIYCCLSNICANTNDKELFDFLVGKIPIEDDDSITVSILSRLRKVKKDSTYNLNLIKKLVAEGTYDVSHAAIKALSFSEDPEVEDLLLSEFKITNKHMKGMICGPLGTIGSPKSIPVLREEYKKTRAGFLRWAIESAIHEIEQRDKAAAKISIANSGA